MTFKDVELWIPSVTLSDKVSEDVKNLKWIYEKIDLVEEYEKDTGRKLIISDEFKGICGQKTIVRTTDTQ